MEEGILTAEKTDEMIVNAVKELIQGRGYENVKANAEGYETPARLTTGDKFFIPDITAISRSGAKNYFEIAIKQEDIKTIASKWRLLSELAKRKNGKFILVVPYGNLRFVNDILKRFYEIEATIAKVGFKA